MSAPLPPPPDSSLRLADQLQLLSQVTEALTYRLLELEERLEGHGVQVAGRLEEIAALESAQGEAMEQRLGETEERLARIEAALRGFDRPGGVSRHLQAVQPPAFQQGLPEASPAATGFDPDPEAADPFPDEGEQPFMDELIAG